MRILRLYCFLRYLKRFWNSNSLYSIWFELSIYCYPGQVYKFFKIKNLTIDRNLSVHLIKLKIRVWIQDFWYDENSCLRKNVIFESLTSRNGVLNPFRVFFIFFRAWVPYNWSKYDPKACIGFGACAQHVLLGKITFYNVCEPCVLNRATPWRFVR
jgi:hypothetical protein